MTLKILMYGTVSLGLILTGCIHTKPKNNQEKMETFTQGTYGYDREFLKSHLEVIELSDKGAAIALVPAYQGRVMTSTCEGEDGFSFGWINYELIRSGKTLEHFNPYGGEERFWIGPEGGQFSVYFNKEEDFVFENWYVPSSIDTEPFELVSQDTARAIFKKELSLKNYSGTEFKLEVSREVRLLTGKQIDESLMISSEDLSVVAYESLNTIRNAGPEKWEKQNGLLSIWILGMLIPSPEVIVIIPVKAGSDLELGPEVNDDYFGRISKDRLKVVNNKVFFKADGKSRGKIGIPPMRATRYMGSYDAKNQVLTLLEYDLPENLPDFVNSSWKLQDNPYGGDALNSYNDGPLENGSQMGPFYELETSSPALALEPGQSYTHLQRTYHFKGEKSSLDKIAIKVLKVSLGEIEEVF